MSANQYRGQIQRYLALNHRNILNLGMFVNGSVD